MPPHMGVDNKHTHAGPRARVCVRLGLVHPLRQKLGQLRNAICGNNRRYCLVTNRNNGIWMESCFQTQKQ